jgi:hypothetical protein
MTEYLSALDQVALVNFMTADGLINGTIADTELALVRHVAQTRQDEAVRTHRPDKHGFTGNGFLIHFLGALGEAAVAHILGVPWSGSINTFKAPDILDCVQVRTRSKIWYELLVRPDDNDSEFFVHVAANLDIIPPNLIVHGYIEGRNAKQPCWLEQHGGRPPAFFVPCANLLPLLPQD